MDAKAVCLFCGSSSTAPAAHVELAAAFGEAIAEAGIMLVYGGGKAGLMGTAADAALAAGGKVTGVIPEHLFGRELGHGGLTDLRVVSSMHERKHMMFMLSDAFVALPGGHGTLDETVEILTWRQLGLHDKPLLLVNADGYWDPFLELAAHMRAHNYIREEQGTLFRVVGGVAEVLPALAAAPEPRHGSLPGRL